MYQREITDEEFLNSFQSFGFASRAAISYLLCNNLVDDSTLRNGDLKAILLQTIENYYFQTEIILMLLETFNQKKLSYDKSLVALYHNTFIREGKDGSVSSKLLKVINENSDNQFLDFLGLQEPEKILNSLTKEKKEELEESFGSFDKAIIQGFEEIKNLKESLISIISNRFKMKDGTEIPFYQMLNKLKHGYQVIENEKENILSILVELVEDKTDRALFSVIEIPVKRETALFYADQIKHMSKVTQHLLHYYLLSNNIK